MAELRIGTCSWKYDSWKGIVYSEKGKHNYLEEYSNHYNTVEVDQWFWSLFGENKVALPSPKTIDEYIGSVPEGFKFSVKLPNSLSLTHFYKQKKSDPLKSNPYFLSKELFMQVKQLLGEFGGKLGPMMLQFEYLNKQKMSSQREFLNKLDSFINAIGEVENLALEIRNPNYLNESFFEFVKSHKVIPVLLQGYYMPPVSQTYEKLREFIGDTIVIRLHGPDRKGIEKITGGDWNKIVASKDDELRGIVEMLVDLLSREVDIYLNVNNHYEGSAPLTINKIKEMLRGKNS